MIDALSSGAIFYLSIAFLFQLDAFTSGMFCFRAQCAIVA